MIVVTPVTPEHVEALVTLSRLGVPIRDSKLFYRANVETLRKLAGPR